jgi:NADP-dependent 3-hydroxy acid dehydrogenase YdfG
MSGEHELEGKVALVTGASSGIGRAVALKLAFARMKVAVAARRARKLEELAAAIKSSGTESLPVTVDLKDEEQLRASIAGVNRALGGVDVLVNAAGLGHVAPLASGKAAHFREMLEVNVLGLAVATREVVAGMKKRGTAGHIVHISSMSAHRVQSGSGMYAATKHAVKALTEGLRLELRESNSPIRVTSISPADTDTSFFAAMYRSRKEAARHRPAYRMLDPEDVADAVLYALTAPPHVEIHDIKLRPIDQPD